MKILRVFDPSVALPGVDRCSSKPLAVKYRFGVENASIEIGVAAVSAAVAVGAYGESILCCRTMNVVR